MFRWIGGDQGLTLEVLGGSGMDSLACEPQQGDQSLFTKIDNN